jgi:sugar phosphate isomerase/epimerase
MMYTRRDIGRLTLAAIAGGKLIAKPNSDFGGVQIGIIVSPVLFKDMPLGADELLKKLVELGINAVELQDVRAEAYAGAPVEGQRGGSRTPAPNQKEARKKAAEEIRQWRLAASMTKYETLRKLYRDAGVNIYAFRAAAIGNDTPDEELAYYFNAAHTLGANQITMELPRDAATTQRLGEYAAKRKILMGYHNHTQVNFNSWDQALEQSKYNGVNFDVGHFAAAVSQSPIPFMEKHHDRISCLHLKDRKFGTNGGQNVPWGQGDTPLKEILVMMRQKKYKFPAGIEMEYPVPEGSNTMAELQKCLQFCKDALA